MIRPGPRVGLVISVVVAVGVLIILFGLGAAARNLGSGDTGTAVTGPPSRRAPTSPAAKPPGLKHPVRDGEFEFVVSRVDCSRSTIGLEHLKRTAAGKYCVISLSIRNIGDRPQLFLGNLQKVYDAAGTEFTNENVAGLFANHDTQTLLRKIDPAHRVSGKIVFDVPKKTTLTAIELHDSYFSGGVTIALR
jgi:hypothetical protein